MTDQESLSSTAFPTPLLLRLIGSEERLKQGVSLRQLAEQIGCGDGSLRQLLRGGTVRYDTAKQIAGALGYRGDLIKKLFTTEPSE